MKRRRKDLIDNEAIARLGKALHLSDLPRDSEEVAQYCLVLRFHHANTYI